MRAKQKGAPAMTTTHRKATTTTKATARKGRAVLGLLATSAGARLLLIGQEHAYVLAQKEHIYVCNEVYTFLRGQQWISPPAPLGTEVLESIVTEEGRRMLAMWQKAANGANHYQQLMFEELAELFKAPAKEASHHQPSLFEPSQDQDQEEPA